MDRSQAQWWRYDLTVDHPRRGTYRTTHHDPAFAISVAAESIRAPLLDNPFTDPAAISLLHLGMPLEARCADGTHVTVTPILM